MYHDVLLALYVRYGAVGQYLCSVCECLRSTVECRCATQLQLHPGIHPAPARIGYAHCMCVRFCFNVLCQFAFGPLHVCLPPP